MILYNITRQIGGMNMNIKISIMIVMLLCMIGMASATVATPALELDESDFGCIDGQFDVLVYDNPTNVQWVVTIDPTIAPISSATGAQLIIADQTAPVFILGVMPGEAGIDYTNPAFKLYAGGWGPATNLIPTGMAVTSNNVDFTKATEFTITIDKTVFDCSTFRWAMNVVIDDDNNPGPDNLQCKYPIGWGWSSPACDYSVFEISCEQQEIPEFPTIALPVAAILGLAFFFQRRKE
jgi:hypothetical protein